MEREEERHERTAGRLGCRSELKMRRPSDVLDLDKEAGQLLFG